MRFLSQTSAVAIAQTKQLTPHRVRDRKENDQRYPCFDSNGHVRPDQGLYRETRDEGQKGRHQGRHVTSFIRIYGL